MQLKQKAKEKNTTVSKLIDSKLDELRPLGWLK